MMYLNKIINSKQKERFLFVFLLLFMNLHSQTEKHSRHYISTISRSSIVLSMVLTICSLVFRNQVLLG